MKIVGKLLTLVAVFIVVVLGVVVGSMIYTVIQGDSPRQRAEAASTSDSASSVAAEEKEDAQHEEESDPLDLLPEEMRTLGGRKMEASISGTDSNGGESRPESYVWSNEFTPIIEFYYSLDKEAKTIKLTRYIGARTKIMMSPVYTINGQDYRLTSMGDDATFWAMADMTSVYIPEGVEHISDTCFKYCYGLEYLYIPSTIKSIQSGFLDCLGEHETYFNSSANLSAERDNDNYPETADMGIDTIVARSAGERVADIANKITDGSFNRNVQTNIYFSGTESKWKSIQN